MDVLRVLPKRPRSRLPCPHCVNRSARLVGYLYILHVLVETNPVHGEIDIGTSVIANSSKTVVGLCDCSIRGLFIDIFQTLARKRKHLVEPDDAVEISTSKTVVSLPWLTIFRPRPGSENSQ